MLEIPDGVIHPFSGTEVIRGVKVKLIHILNDIELKLKFKKSYERFG